MTVLDLPGNRDVVFVGIQVQELEDNEDTGAAVVNVTL